MLRLQTVASSPQDDSSIKPGQRYGKLVAVGFFSNNKGDGVRWTFRCDCGKEITPRVRFVLCSHGKRGPQRSCGCAKYDRILNARFGRLVAVEHSGSKQGLQPMWRCKCDCGKESLVTSANLLGGGVRSCGCLRHRAVLPAGNWPDITDAYAAGFIDGDGSILISSSPPSERGRKRRTQYFPVLYATGTDEAVLRSFQKKYGGAVNATHDRRARKRNWRRGFMWVHTITSKSTFFDAIVPHLILRRNQAAIALQLASLKRMGVHLSDDDHAAQKSLRDEMVRLNHTIECPHSGDASVEYAAGLFDAEGNVGTYRNGGSWRVTATISNNCRCVCDAMKRLFGGGVRRGHGGWRWEVKGTYACSMLARVFPHLIVKKERARIAIEFGKTVGVGHKVSPTVNEHRCRLRNELLLLNQKGTQLSMLVGT